MEILHQNENQDYGNECLIMQSIMLFEEFGETKIRFSKNYVGNWFESRPEQTELRINPHSDNIKEEISEFFEDHMVHEDLRFDILEFI